MTLYENCTWINQLRAKVKRGSSLAVILWKCSASLNELRRESVLYNSADTEKESVATLAFCPFHYLIHVAQQTKRKGNALVHLDNLSKTFSSVTLRVFGSNKTLIQIKAFLLMWRLLQSACLPVPQRLGRITTNEFPLSLPLSVSHNSEKQLWLCGIRQRCGWDSLLR